MEGYLNQNVKTTASPTFAGLTLSGAGLTQNSNGLGMKLASYGTTLGIGVQSGVQEYITGNSGDDHRWGYGTSGSLTETMFLDSGTKTLSVDNINVASTLTAGGELRSTADNGLRLVNGNYGLMFRNDGSNFYMLYTASGDQYGGWNSLRPFRIDNVNGHVYLGNSALTVEHSSNVTVANNLTVNGAVRDKNKVGVIQMKASSNLPTYALWCNGAAVSRTTYADLFADIGTTWGAGDGSTTFNLPDMDGGTFARGSSSAGGTGGSATHLHSVDPPNTNTGTASSNVTRNDGLFNELVSRDEHTHSVNIPAFNSASGSSLPPYANVRYFIWY